MSNATAEYYNAYKTISFLGSQPYTIMTHLSILLVLVQYLVFHNLCGTIQNKNTSNITEYSSDQKMFNRTVMQ